MFIFARNTTTTRSCAHHATAWCGALVLLFALSQISVASACADDDPSESERDTIRRMNEQIRELQAKVKELEERLNNTAMNSQTRAADGTSPAVTIAAAESTPVVSASPVTSSPVTSSPVTSSLTPRPEAEEEKPVPAVKLRMFGDVGYEVSDEKGETNSFHIGTLDLFMTGALTDRLSVLGEVLFLPSPDNSFSLDVERLLLKYKQNDYFDVAVGRYHSSIGYYNTAFHQGAWFQTTIDRPFMYAFDDQGGFLPLQEVGATIDGQIPSGNLALNYVAEIGNGRAHVLGSDPAQNFQDTNNGKSFNLALYSRQRWLPGLQAGFSIYHDHLTFSDNFNHDELISTVHIVYTDSKYELLNEAMLVRHTNSMLGAPGVFHTPGFYTQFSRRFGNYRPYFRYAYVNAGVAEPIYGDPADGPIVGRRNGPTLGLRYELNDHAAWKLQYDYLSQRGEKSFNMLETQLSFAF
jgi:hypothetical protein